MATIIEALTDNTPRYFSTQEVAFKHHYNEGGLLWKRMDGMPDAYKPFASGVLPVSRLAIYEIFMVDGRQPNDENIAQATKTCYDVRDHENQTWFHAPL